MTWLRTLQHYFPKHKYAIDTKWLGDNAVLAWSNLGYWQQEVKSSYPQACQTLAMRLADGVRLNAEDRLLDLGCGQGASLILWQQNYGVRQLAAVELQWACVQRIQDALRSNVQMVQASFLDVNLSLFTAPFNVVLSVDAAYHSPLSQFLDAVHGVLETQGRIGFHYLVLSETFLTLNHWQRLQLKAQLKAADIDLDQLPLLTHLQDILDKHGYKQGHIEDISEAVLAGFSSYYATHLASYTAYNLDHFKIKMTAKLCQNLFERGIVRYVQITAIKP